MISKSGFNFSVTCMLHSVVCVCVCVGMCVCVHLYVCLCKYKLVCLEVFGTTRGIFGSESSCAPEALKALK